MVGVLRRRGWVLLAALVVSVGCAYFVASSRGVSYSAESTAVVAASPNSLLTPDQANLLAGTYAVLIPKDSVILHAVASTLGTTVADVEHRLSVSNTAGTALLGIDYRGTSAANSIAGASAALAAISGPAPVSANIIPGSVGAVQAPTQASASRGVAVLVAVGAFVGLALGALLMMVWERVDPRIDRPGDLSEETGSPAWPASALSQSGATALVARWAALAEPGPARIGLVPVTADVLADLPRVARSFGPLGVAGNGNGNGSGGRGQSRGGGPAVVAFRVPSADLGELQLIMDCDLVVLVARRGTPRAVLRELVDSLREFGISPQWAIFLGSRNLPAAAV